MVNSTGSKAIYSGALAKATGVSPDTIRHYEKVGVLPKALRTESGYRMYPASAVERVLVVRRALRIGFTLAELAEVLKARDSGGAPCHRVYKLAQAKLEGVAANIKDLKRTQCYMKQVLREWKHRMQHTVPGQRANLLHLLKENSEAPRKKASEFRRERL
jgi:MerR family transcriptional regulator, copper efflux regulator